jgi:hypothetical protein
MVSTDKSCVRRMFVLDVGVKKNMASKPMVTTLTKDFPDPDSIIVEERILFGLIR